MSVTDGGTMVYLRGCPVGRPGTVVGVKRGRVLVFWHDLDYLGKHATASLTVAQPAARDDNPEKARDELARLEKANGGPFPQREGELPAGRRLS